MAVNREELIARLNDLIQTCRDGEQGFQTRVRKYSGRKPEGLVQKMFAATGAICHRTTSRGSAVGRRSCTERERQRVASPRLDQHQVHGYRQE